MALAALAPGGSLRRPGARGGLDAAPGFRALGFRVWGSNLGFKGLGFKGLGFRGLASVGRCMCLQSQKEVKIQL